MALQAARDKELQEQTRKMEEDKRKWQEAEERHKRCHSAWKKTRRSVMVVGNWHEAYRDHLAQIQEIVDEWDMDHVKVTIRTIFNECEKTGDGQLSWNNSEIRHFINLLFKEHGLEVPALEETHWYQLYRNFDKDRNYQLGFEECVQFAKYLHEECLRRGGGQSHGLQHQYAHARPEIESKVTSWDDPEVQRIVLRVFNEVDRNGNRLLTWNDSEIRCFIRRVFDAMGLPTPQLPETVWYQLYREVDIDGTYSMSQAEALEFAKHVYQRILDFYPKGVPDWAKVNTPRSANPGGTSPRYPASTFVAAAPARDSPTAQTWHGK